MSINRRTKKFRRNQDQFQTKRLNRLRQQADAQTAFDSTHGGGIIQNAYGQHRRVGTPGVVDQPTILFKIVSADTDNCQATAQVLGRPCGATSVDGEDADGEVELVDPLCCILDEADADLVGRMGYAVRMELDYEWAECCTDSYGIPTGECIWVITQLCCPDPCE